MPSEKMEIFAQMVMKEASEKNNAILKEIEKERKSVLESEEARVLDEIYKRIQKEILEIRRDAGRKLSEKVSAYQKDTIAEREKISEKVFSLLREKIEDYTAKDEYKNDMQKRLSGYELTEDAEIECREKDIAVFEKISSAKVIADNGILLGGFKIHYKNKHIKIDESFDLKYEDAKKYFTENSGLSI